MPKGVDNRGVSDGQKIKVLRRDGFSCVYCGKTGRESNLEIDHRIPHSKGGDNHISNLFTSCQDCNRKKGTATWDVTTNPDFQGLQPSVLDGIFVHTFEPVKEMTDEGCDMKDTLKYEDINKVKLSRQGEVLGMFGSLIAVRLFSWLDGRPTNVEMFSFDKATDGSMIFYDNAEEMNRSLQNYDEAKYIIPKEISRAEPTPVLHVAYDPQWDPWGDAPPPKKKTKPDGRTIAAWDNENQPDPEGYRDHLLSCNKSEVWDCYFEPEQGLPKEDYFRIIEAPFGSEAEAIIHEVFEKIGIKKVKQRKRRVKA